MSSTKEFNEYLEKHAIEKDVYLEKFEEVLKSSPQSEVEFSIKIADNKKHFTRMNIWFPQDPSRNIKHIGLINKYINEIKENNIGLNLSIYNTLINKEFIQRYVRFIVFGIDLRGDTSSSSIKIWFSIRRNMGLLRKLVQLSEISQGAYEILRESAGYFPLSVCVSLGFNRITSLKLYAKFSKKYIQEKRNYLISKFGNNIDLLLKGCSGIHISFKDSKPKIHFKQKKIFDFLRLINKLEEVEKLLPIDIEKRSSYISLEPEEINKSQVRNLTLYFLNRK